MYLEVITVLRYKNHGVIHVCVLYAYVSK